VRKLDSHAAGLDSWSSPRRSRRWTRLAAVESASCIVGRVASGGLTHGSLSHQPPATRLNNLSGNYN
jgi:glutamate synthase domain-containing protein 2